jgi:hypothetical protein
MVAAEAEDTDVDERGERDAGESCECGGGVTIGVLHIEHVDGLLGGIEPGEERGWTAEKEHIRIENEARAGAARVGIGELAEVEVGEALVAEGGEARERENGIEAGLDRGREGKDATGKKAVGLGGEGGIEGAVVDKLKGERAVGVAEE